MLLRDLPGVGLVQIVAPPTPAVGDAWRAEFAVRVRQLLEAGRSRHQICEELRLTAAAGLYRDFGAGLIGKIARDFVPEAVLRRRSRDREKRALRRARLQARRQMLSRVKDPGGPRGVWIEELPPGL